MKPDRKPPLDPAEDRAALREELLRAEERDRLQVFDALNREADADEEEVPQMPEELRDKLVEQFGDRAPRRAAAAAVPAAPGFMANLVAFFQARPLAAYGGLAAAACAVMFVMLQTGGVDDGGGSVDHLRGGGDGRPAATAEVAVYLFPESGAAKVLALMAPGREVVVCADAEDFESRRGDDWAVAVDLDRRVVLTFEGGKATGESAVEGEGPRAVLLGVRSALDAMVK